MKIRPIQFSAFVTDVAPALKQSGAIRFGVERECLRCDQSGMIAQTDHPTTLGATLTHPLITTDYSEALLELITPPLDTADELLDSLERIHRYVSQNLAEGETLWPASMPCRLDGPDSIRIAEYGPSNIGQMKHIYRRGLETRYGRTMQSIAGLHFNFSLSETFWSSYLALAGATLAPPPRVTAENGCQSNDDMLRSEAYFGLIRNFRRWSWLLMYLFGASPVVDKSFLQQQPHKLTDFGNENFGLPWATSLRMGDIGYKNNAQDSLNICFNHLDSYTQTLYNATHTPYPRYQAIGMKKDGAYLQLNTHILQIENEYYSSVRPKRVARSGEKPTAALRRGGVEYIEVRCLDINPFLPLGADADQVSFMELFLVTCLFAKSPYISIEDCHHIDSNFASVVNAGRQPGLELSVPGEEGYESIALTSWGHTILDAMQVTADLIAGDVAGRRPEDYAKAISMARARLEDAALTPSAMVLDQLQDQRFIDWGLRLAAEHQAELHSQRCDAEDRQRFADAARQSLEDAAAIAAADEVDFDTFLERYMADSPIGEQD
ncbi:glutamate--cysteine ligase [Allohahella marinimesophila]|uniref:Glutamate--cysteine ligase n=1 Tax=Allohahella marinimesophila TaxID=1054972 RepID=A0ABP7PAS4_9GAMM